MRSVWNNQAEDWPDVDQIAKPVASFCSTTLACFSDNFTTGNRSLMLKGIKNAALLNIDKKLARHVICACSLLLS
jgi:hypothetical protein